MHVGLYSILDSITSFTLTVYFVPRYVSSDIEGCKLEDVWEAEISQRRMSSATGIVGKTGGRNIQSYCEDGPFR